MTAALAQNIKLKPTWLEVFEARCEARALLFGHDALELIEAVDGLQNAALAYGLVDDIGQDAVQVIMARAFAPRRELS